MDIVVRNGRTESKTSRLIHSPILSRDYSVRFRPPNYYFPFIAKNKCEKETKEVCVVSAKPD